MDTIRAEPVAVILEDRPEIRALENLLRIFLVERVNLRVVERRVVSDARLRRPGNLADDRHLAGRQDLLHDDVHIGGELVHAATVAPGVIRAEHDADVLAGENGEPGIDVLHAVLRLDAARAAVLKNRIVGRIGRVHELAGRAVRRAGEIPRAGRDAVAVDDPVVGEAVLRRVDIEVDGRLRPACVIDRADVDADPVVLREIEYVLARMVDVVLDRYERLPAAFRQLAARGGVALDRVVLQVAVGHALLDRRIVVVAAAVPDDDGLCAARLRDLAQVIGQPARRRAVPGRLVVGVVRELRLVARGIGRNAAADDLRRGQRRCERRARAHEAAGGEQRDAALGQHRETLHL